VSFSCEQIRIHFERYAAEELSAAERRAVREHLALCDACRAESIAGDPALLFAGAAAGPEEVSPADVSRILEGVRAGVALKQAERRLGRRNTRRRASTVAAAVAVALFTLALPGGFSRREVEPPPMAAPTAARVITPGFANASVSAGPSQGTEPGSVTVYEIAPGSGPNEPRVVWIVDKSLDI